MSIEAERRFTMADPPADKRSRNEHIKEASRQLRGTIAEGLAAQALSLIHI